jgi:stress response protein SCP2
MDELQNIQNLIYEIRGVKVMLDKDLADLYHVTTGNLNKAVKRNQKRFPLDFMFQLNQEEFQKLKENLIFQNGISNWGGTRKLPYAFTEQGLAMLSGLLNSDIAINVNINIMRAFVQMRQALITINNAQLQLEQIRSEVKQLRIDMDETLHDQNDINESTRAQLDAISTALAELQAKPSETKTRKPIGFIQPEDDDNKK